MNKKIRSSNIELLRMVAMFLVLLVHADYFSLGSPSVEEIRNNTLDSALRIFFEALSIVCVNVFVLISGWFGIRPSLRGISNFLFQCLFFLIGIYVVTLAVGTSTLSLKGIAGCFALTKLNWFIKAYLLLYIISPVLNEFVEHAERRVFRNVLICFFAFACTYGWIGAAEFMMGGYSTLFFIGLYLLARYIRIYKPWFSRLNIYSDISIYMCVTIFITTLCLTPPYICNMNIQPYWTYLSPNVIVGAVFLLLAFSKLNFQSLFVNWCGASCFAVFLIHTNPNTLWHFKDLFVFLHSNSSEMEFWSITFILLLAIFFIAILVDQIRLFLWKRVWDLIEKNSYDKYSK